MKDFIVINLTMVFLLFISFGIVSAEDTELITAIDIEGNRIIEDSEILQVITTKAGTLLDREQLKSDIKAIGEMGYFQDVRISFKSYQGGLKAIFEVVENPVITDIIIKGNDSIASETLLELNEVKRGEILNVNKLDQTIKNIQNKYQDEGYILAKFVDVNVSNEGVLNLLINEGYLNTVVINGNEKTKDFVILRELGLKDGQVLNINQIQEGFQNLYRLNYFENIEPRLEGVQDKDKPNYANLVIDLKEANTGNFNMGGGWSSKDGWFGFVRIKERNLLGKGQSLGFEWQFGEVTNYSLSFYEPWLMGTPTSFGVNLYDKRKDSSDPEKGDYNEHRQGGSISLGHPLKYDWEGMIKFKAENSSTDWVSETYIDEDGLEQNLLDEEGSTRSITLQVHRDTSNHPFNPTDGDIDTVSVEYAGQLLGGDNNFTKYNLELRRFYPGFKRGHAWALRLKTGFGVGEIPWYEKYRLGGSESLRGYDPGYLSGDNMLLLNAEYRFPIADNFTGVIFADGGNTWYNTEESQLEELHYSMGLGVRMNTPIGQIRLDYGFNEDGQGQPHFSIGHTF